MMEQNIKHATRSEKSPLSDYAWYFSRSCVFVCRLSIPGGKTWFLIVSCSNQRRKHVKNMLKRNTIPIDMFTTLLFALVVNFRTRSAHGSIINAVLRKRHKLG